MQARQRATVPQSPPPAVVCSPGSRRKSPAYCTLFSTAPPPRCPAASPSQRHVPPIECRAVNRVDDLVQGEVFLQRRDLGFAGNGSLEMRPFGTVRGGEGILPADRPRG